MTEENSQFKMLHQPITTDLPTEIEIKASLDLENFLKEKNAFDTEENKKLRTTILTNLTNLANQLIKDIKGLSNDEICDSQARIIPSGSVLLDVCSPESDIDAVFVAPEFVKRTEHFFKLFPNYLIKDQNVSKLKKIEHANVPIISFKYFNIDVDLSFAAIPLKTIPNELNLLDDTILENMNEKCIKSINSLRVGELIPKLVPDLNNFLTLLRFVRYYSTQKYLNGNMFGYLGGINLAILSAFICQRYPNATSSFLVYSFFSDISQWDWSKPLFINKPNIGVLLSWENINNREIMPIITPAYPSTNSLYTATHSTKNRIIEEFKNASIETEKVLLEGKSWNILFEKSKFFEKFSQYIEISISADNEDDFDNWKEIVSSKVRKLMIQLEYLDFIKSAPLFPYIFKDKNNLLKAYYYYGIRLDKNYKGDLNLSNPISKFIQELLSVPFRPLSSQVIPKALKSKDLPSFIFNERIIKKSLKPKKVSNKK